MKQFSTTLITCFLFVFARSQAEVETIVSQRLEFIAEQAEIESVEFIDFEEELRYRMERPINLNQCTKEDLYRLGFISPIQINSLFQHIQDNGKLMIIFELQSIEGWDLISIELLRPFITVDDRFEQVHASIPEMIRYSEAELFLRYQRIVEEKRGYAEDKYLGSPDKYYSRFRWKYRNNLSLGITAEKDPGEVFHSRKGFDFYSAHFYYAGGKYLRKIALGDYSVQCGQGLTFWTSLAQGKSSNPFAGVRNPVALKPYSSADESRFMRGAAVEVGFNKISLLSFLSYKKRDATFLEDSSSLEVSSISATGFHNTVSYLDRKKNLDELIYGERLEISFSNLTLGASLVVQKFGHSLEKEVQPYNQFDFRGKELISNGIDYRFNWQNFTFFGETSSNLSVKNTSTLNGMIASLHPRLSVSVIQRSYSKEYHSFYTAAFSERSRPANEKGVQVGGELKLRKRLNLTGYLDVFAFPWLNYLVDGPSDGQESMLQLTYRPNRKMQMYVRYRNQDKLKNSRDTDGTISDLENVNQQNFRVNFEMNLKEGIRWKSRIEYVYVERKSNTPEQGWLFYQDLRIKPKMAFWDITFRYALFDTDSYDSRIYAYESNVLYVMSIPAHYYQGSRLVVLLRLDFAKRFSLWMKVGQSVLSNRKSIGSGNEEIMGNVKTDVNVQLRIKL